MRATRRHERAIVPLATNLAVRAICEQLREPLPDLIPNSEKQLVRLLRCGQARLAESGGGHFTRASESPAERKADEGSQPATWPSTV